MEDLCTDDYVVVGTYEGGILGWKLNFDNGNNPTIDVKSSLKSQKKKRKFEEIEETSLISPFELEQVFGYCSHQGTVRTVSTPSEGNKKGSLLASGGSDEFIKIYNIALRQEAGELSHHKGTINCLEFVNSRFLLCGSEDGVISIWRIHDWTLHHLLGGHKGGITGLAVHPSGRLALSTSRDRTLRLWNLIEGRCAYINRLNGIGENLSWSPDGTKYTYIVGSSIYIEDTRIQKSKSKESSSSNKANSTYSLELKNTRPVSLLWLNEDLLAMSSENKQIFILSLKEGDKIIAQNQNLPYLIDRISTESLCQRVKTMSIEKRNIFNVRSSRGTFFHWWIGSSDGKVLLVEYNSNLKGEIRVVNSTSAGEGTRILCITRCLSNDVSIQNYGEKVNLVSNTEIISNPPNKRQKKLLSPSPSPSKASINFDSKKSGKEL